MLSGVDLHVQPGEIVALCGPTGAGIGTALAVTGGTQIESRRLLFARAEVERTPGLDFLHESGMRQIFQPCLGLVSRLLGKSPEDPEMAFRTLGLAARDLGPPRP